MRCAPFSEPGTFLHKQKNLSLKIGLLFSFPGLAGVFSSRAYIVPSLPETIIAFQNLTVSKDSFILIIFAVMMILASYSMIFGRLIKSGSKPLKPIALIALGFTVGVVTGVVGAGAGAGGGFIIIPVLNTFAGLDIKKAIGTSLLIISINSLLGFFGDLIVTTPDWLLLLKLSLLAIIGILAGAYFNSKVPAKFLKKGFGVFVLTLGTWIIYKQMVG